VAGTKLRRGEESAVRAKLKKGAAIVLAVSILGMIAGSDAWGAEPDPGPPIDISEGTGARLTRMIDDTAADGAARALSPASTASGPDLRTDAELSALAATGRDVIGASIAHANGIDGTGTRVVVIDGGFDLTHPALAGSVNPELEGCFVTGASVDPCPDDGDGDPNSSTGAGAASNCPAVDCTYGTYAASLTLGRGGAGTSPGIAPGAELVPIRVLQTDPSDGSQFAYAADLAAALQYVRELDSIHGVHVIALGFGEGAYLDHACSGDPNVTSQIMHLAPSVEIVAPAGGGGAPGRTAFPACLYQVT
jgi:subtilisin family serine protease